MKRLGCRRWLVPFCLALLLGGLALPATPVSAATQHVTNCGDAGANTLRGKIGAAAVGDTIVFDQNCTITLATGTLTLTQDVTIDGTGHTIVVDGGCTANCGTTSAVGGVTVFLVGTANAVTAHLTALTIQHGNSPVGSNGGGIYNRGTLTVTNCTISGNNSHKSVDAVGGGGIYNEGYLTVTNSTISGNSANGDGGGISSPSSLTVTNSTFSGNTTTDRGGAIQVTSLLKLANSTLIGNSAQSGGGIYLCRMYAVSNTIIAGNGASVYGPDIYDLPCESSATISGGHNLIGTTDSVVFTLGPGDLVNPTPLLGAPGNYGGPTQTVTLLPGSPAIAAGTAGAGIPTTDQRGVARIGHTDIGAFQSQGFSLAKTGGDNQHQQAGAPWNEPVQGGTLIATSPPPTAPPPTSPASPPPCPPMGK